jgi:hypothetical protein
VLLHQGQRGMRMAVVGSVLFFLLSRFADVPVDVLDGVYVVAEAEALHLLSVVVVVAVVFFLPLRKWKSHQRVCVGVRWWMYLAVSVPSH